MPLKKTLRYENVFSEMFKSSADTSLYQLKKHYPEIYKVMLKD
jgi:hypothetical protein